MADRRTVRSTAARSVHMTTRNLVLPFLVILVVIYATSYFVLSRRGHREAETYELKGFYYFTPEDSDEWRRKNFGCVVLFAPLNFIDRTLGFGRHPASEPLWRVS